MTSLHIHLLGDFYMEYDGELVTAVDSTRLQSLLVYLLLHSHALQPRHHIAFCFWPDSSERQARNNLRKTLHQLRHSLPQPLPEADDPYGHWLRINGRTV